jgi:hypothetical protein
MLVTIFPDKIVAKNIGGVFLEKCTFSKIATRRLIQEAHFRRKSVQKQAIF